MLRLPQAIRQLEFSPDGARLITLDATAQLRIWDAKAGSESELIPGHAGNTFTATFDPSGRLVAAVSDHNTVRIWDVSTKELKRELANFTGEIYDIAFSPAGTRLATAGHEGVIVWSLESGNAIFRFAAADGIHFSFADRVEFARRGSWLVGAHDGGATIWDLATGTEVRSFRPPNTGEWLSSACLTADASRLATCGQEGVLQLWDTATGRELFKVEAEDTLYTLTFSPDEKQIVACGNDILIVDAETGKELAAFRPRRRRVYRGVFPRRQTSRFRRPRRRTENLGCRNWSGTAVVTGTLLQRGIQPGRPSPDQY